MRVAVVIGRVLDPRGIAVNRRIGRVFVNREEYIMEPADRCALEMALRIKDATGCEVIALPRGILPDADELRWAIATGADRAVHLTSGSGHDFDLDDAASARLLTAALQRLGTIDMLLVGARTLETGQGQLGPRLAEALGWTQVLEALQVGAADGKLRAVVKPRRGSESCDTEYVSVITPLPCVVTVAAGAVKPRYADGARLVGVFRGVGGVDKLLEEWSVDELVDPHALMPDWERRGRRFPPVRELGYRVTGTAEEVAAALSTALQQHLPRRGI